MSVVTGVTLISQCCDDMAVEPLIAQLNEWIKNDPTCGDRVGLKQVDEFYGGYKHPENLVWGGGFNYLHWREFIDFARSLPWREAMTIPGDENVILVVSPDQRNTEVVLLTEKRGNVQA